MTQQEYRQIEARLDAALRLFSETETELAADERQILQNLILARKEVHELRIEHEAGSLV